MVMLQTSYEGEMLLGIAADLETAKMVAEAEVRDSGGREVGVWEDEGLYIELALDDFNYQSIYIQKEKVVV